METVLNGLQFSRIERGKYIMSLIHGAGFSEDEFQEFCELVRERLHAKGVRMKSFYCFPFGYRAPSKKKQVATLRDGFCLTHKQARYFLKYAGRN